MGRTAVFVLHYPTYGGPHNRVRRLHGALAERGWRAVAVLPTEPGNAAARLEDSGVEVVRTPLSRLRRSADPRLHLGLALRFRGEVRRLRSIMHAQRADVVVLATLPNVQGALAARAERRPLLWQIVDSATPPAVRRAVMPLVRRMADAVLFGGAALEPLHLGGRPLAQPSAVVRPAVDTDRFTPAASARSDVRGELGIAAGAPVVGTVANLNPTKGVHDFVRAAVLTTRELQDARHLVVGLTEGVHASYVESVRGTQRAAGLKDDQLIFLGDRDDVERVLAAMDLLMISSVPRSEGTTTTAMEAGACGVPVVSTDVGAVSEVVSDGVTGYLVEPGDAQALSRRALEILRAPELAASLGKAGRERAVEAFGIDAAAERYVALLEAAVRHRAAK